MRTNMIRWEYSDDKIAVLTLDDPNKPVNSWGTAFLESLDAAVTRLETERDDIAGVILISAKETFCAGADLKEISARFDDVSTEEITAAFDGAKSLLRRLETFGKPVVAAIAGSALGGGLELALAAHHRIVVDDPKIQIGLPEVTLGAIPGAGGVARTVRMLGLTNALLNVLVRGEKHRPADAQRVGLVDELIDTPEQLLPAAKAWIVKNPAPAQVWDRPGYQLPGGRPTDAELSQNALAFTANVQKQLKGADFPAVRNLVSAALEGALVGFDAACTIETRYLVNLFTSPRTLNRIEVFFELQEVNKGGVRPADWKPFRPRTLAMIGAGMMGAGIAYEFARAGVEVVLKDVSVQAAERGKDYSRSIVEKAVARGRWTRARADELLARITPTADLTDLTGADLMIEAVFEDPALKKAAYGEVEPKLAPGAVLASNTSQIPITALAEGVTRPADFIGMHFSSPVDKMPMVEVVKGELTAPETVARAVDAVKLINKTPIVVNDGRGFYLTRLFVALTMEGVAMLADGVPPASIEQAAAQAGFAAQPLLVLDQVSLSLAHSIIADNQAAAKSAGGTFTPGPAERVIMRMVDEFQRLGRAAGAGFYDYAEGKRLGFWPGLRKAFGGNNRDLSLTELQERMLFAVALEVARCLQEGIVETNSLANVGSLTGGLPPWTGGALRFIEGHDGGVRGFAARARQLSAVYGERFEPPASLCAGKLRPQAG